MSLILAQNIYEATSVCWGWNYILFKTLFLLLFLC